MGVRVWGASGQAPWRGRGSTPGLRLLGVSDSYQEESYMAFASVPGLRSCSDYRYVIVEYSKSPTDESSTPSPICL